MNKSKNNNNNKRISMYSSDEVIEEFYKAIATGDVDTLKRVHIPRSEVFYVRYKYFLDTGDWITLDRKERAMYLEGMITSDDVLDPERERDWEINERERLQRLGEENL